ncbi:MAG: ABC transporter ATP-binding protein [Candidatus Pacebacteria bacterium]|jgi:putative ABC transport system ATP-binding protein|nr:ABC transporter ATP-binding protein [Candidatus Paceibacterota bacterium]
MNQLLNKNKTSNKDAILEIGEIRKSFKIGNNEIEIIKGISFQVNKGDFIIIFGSSGCGKSTILNILLGLEPPTTGKVNFLNKDLYKMSEDERAQLRKKEIGTVYQQSNWIKALTVLENVAFPLMLQGFDLDSRVELAKEALNLVEMTQAFDQIPTELSAGQQQRVSLARALITKPSLLVADEPTGNLDSKSGEEIMALFKDFNQRGHTVVMVTHDLEYLKYASRSIQISDGELLAEHQANAESLKKLAISKRGNIDSSVKVGEN